MVSGALLLSASAPVLLAGAGAALLGGAIYGLSVGSQSFHWGEAILGAVLGGISAGVGSWLAGTTSSLVAKIGVLAADVIGGGISGLASYVIHSPDWTWRGAVGAFTLGAGMSGLFAGLGAVASRFWTWGKDIPVLLNRQPNARAMVAAALEALPGPGAGGGAVAGGMARASLGPGVSHVTGLRATNGATSTAATTSTAPVAPRAQRVIGYIGNGRWQSAHGLIYGQGSKHGNRILHMLAHLKPDPRKRQHTVFNVAKDKLLELIDEAWAMRGTPMLDKGNEIYLVDMGRVIGTAGETVIKIVVKPGTAEIKTAYPIMK